MAYKDAATLAGTIVADMTEPPGEAANVAWLKNGETAIQTISNRPHQALAENCDFLRAAINRDLGLPTVGVLATFSGNSIDIDPSGGAAGDVNYTGTLYLGESGWAGQERYDQLFQLLDEDYQEVSVDGVEAKITGLSGGNSLGDGFVSTLTTLDLNVTVPSGNYRIGYYEGTDLENIPPYAFTHAGLRGLEEVSGELKEHKARFDIGELTSFSDFSVGIDATGGSYPLADISMSPAGFIYLGGPSYTGGGTEEAGFLFQFLDEDYNPVVVDGEVVKVESVFPALGSGFYDGVAAVAQLTLNKTVPTGNYRVVFPRNDSIAELEDDAIVKGVSRYAHEHLNYKGVTAVLTDGTNSTGGDYNGPNAIDNMVGAGKPFGGTYILKPGRYTWNTATSLGWSTSVYGETYAWDTDLNAELTSMEIPAAAASNFTLQGQHKNLILSSKSATRRYKLQNVVLDNVEIQPGCAYIEGDITWRGGGCTGYLTGNSPTSDYTLEINSAVSIRGVIEDCTFGAPPAGGSQTAVLRTSAAGISGINLKFVNCTFGNWETPGCTAVDLQGTVSGRLVFENCKFWGSDGGLALNSSGNNTDNVEFRNCNFFTYFKGCVHAYGGAKFDNCKFWAGSIQSQSAAWSTPFYFGAGCKLVDCYFHAQDSAIVTNPASVSAPVFHYDKAASLEEEYGSIRNVYINLGIDSGYWHGYTPVVIEGPSSNKLTIVEDLTVEQLGQGPQYDRSTNGALGLAAVLEFVGPAASGNGAQRCIKARNIYVKGIRASSVTDNGVVVGARGCAIDNLVIDGSGLSSGSGYVGSGGGLVKLTSEVILTNSHICTNYAIPCDYDYLIRLGSDCVIDGMILDQLPTTYTVAIIGFAGLESTVRRVHADTDFLANSTLPFIYGGNYNWNTIHDNYFNFGSHTGSAALIDIPAGENIRVTNNTFFVNKNPGAAVNTPGDGNLVAGNIFQFTVTPVITNTGTGSVTGNNVLTT